MTDRFADFQPSLSGPASTGFSVVPNDAADLPEATRALYVGTGGDIALVDAAGNAVIFKAVPQGSVLPVRARAVRVAGTTAADLVGLV